MAISKKQAVEISKLINSLMCYEIMNRHALESNNRERAKNSRRWYNEAADSLISMGIHVVKFNDTL